MTPNRVDPKFRQLCALLRGAIRDGVPIDKIAKRSKSSPAMLKNWLAGNQYTCRLDKAQAVLRAIDAEMGLGD